MISAVILTKNEEKNIEKCLESVSWCDERIVIDDYSQDKTVEIVKKSGAIVFQHKLVNFSDQRNFGLEKANGDWILFVDADERVSPALCFEINQHINNPIENNTGFNFRRIDNMFGQEMRYGEASALKFLRLAKKGSGKWKGDVHEEWVISGKVLSLNNPLYHFPHQSVEEFISEINRYTDLRANELYAINVKTNWLLIILYPKFKFIYNYLFKLGFLDGIPGLISAIIMSFHSFLVRGKLWLLWQRTK